VRFKEVCNIYSGFWVFFRIKHINQFLKTFFSTSPATISLSGGKTSSRTSFISQKRGMFFISFLKDFCSTFLSPSWKRRKKKFLFPCHMHLCYLIPSTERLSSIPGHQSQKSTSSLP